MLHKKKTCKTALKQAIVFFHDQHRIGATPKIQSLKLNSTLFQTVLRHANGLITFQRCWEIFTFGSHNLQPIIEQINGDMSN